jgi:glycerol-3-phosphate dehydrogenase (NAD(P)+)
MNITLLGAGAWGTALAVSLAERHAVLLWGRDAVAMRIASDQRENAAYLPGITLPQSLLLTSDFEAAMAHCAAIDSLLIVASSVAGLRPIVQRLLGRSPGNLVWLCKGFEEGSGLLPHQIVQQVLGDDFPCGALSGPSFAMEVARGLPGALAIASDNAGLRNSVVQAVHGPQLRIYATDDVIGVEVGGAVKNILAIATGIVDGMGLGLNARAALITRLAGMGDLILTCTGDLSRNRKVGLALAQGKTLAAIERELGHVAEGVRCAREVRALAASMQIEMPITDAVAGVLFDGNTPGETVASLLAREARNEAT